MKFFFDRCMAISLSRMTAILETGKHEVVHHDQDARFTQFTTDIEWMTTLSKDAVRPVVITGDCRILRRPDEVKALQKTAMTFFCLENHWAEMPLREMPWKFFKVWIDVVAKANPRDPTVYTVRGGQSLKVEVYSKTASVR